MKNKNYISFNTKSGSPVYFNSPTKGRLEFSSVIDEINFYIKEDLSADYKIIIGTDSHAREGGSDFITALVIYRIGHGGRYFWYRSEVKKFDDLWSRIYQEVYLSINLAQIVEEEIKKHKELNLFFQKKSDFLHYSLEVHIDVGDKGPTKKIVQEVVGMVSGSGFLAKVKPESFGASNVADRYT